MRRSGRLANLLYRFAPALRDLARRNAPLVRARWTAYRALVFDAGTLASATVISQGLRIAILPALSRLYSPAEFGAFQIFTSILGALGLVSTGGYDKAVVFASSERRATSVLLVGCCTATAMAALTLLCAAAFGTAIATALKSSGLEVFLVALLPLGVIAVGFGESARYYSARQRHFPLIAKALTAQAVITAALQVGLGFFPHIGSGGLIVSRVCGIALLGAVVWTAAWQAVSTEWSKISWTTLRNSAYRYRKFPLTVTPTSLLSQTVYIAPVFVVAKFFSPEDVGLFGVVMLLLSAPMQFVGSAVEQVFYRNAMKERLTTGLCSASIKQSFFLLAVIGTALGLVLLLLAKPAVSIFLGQEWVAAGDFARWMAPMIVLNLIAMPLQPSFVVTGHQSLLFVHQALRTVASVTVLWVVASHSGDLRMSVIAFGVAEVVMHSIGIFLAFCVSRGRFARPATASR